MRLHSAIFCLIIIFSCKESANKPIQIQEKNFEWILGEWNRTNDKEGQNTYEHWVQIAGDIYLGFGFTLAGQDTIFKENLSINKAEDVWRLSVAGVNADTVHFEITEWTNNHFKSQNKTHDFPKFIQYELKDDKLSAEISDGSTSIPFIFIRT